MVLADARSESIRPGPALVETSPSDDLVLDDAVLDDAVLADVDDQVWPVLEQLARAMRVPDAELAPTLAAAVRMAAETIGPADYAGLVLVLSKAIEPVVMTGEPVRTALKSRQLIGRGTGILMERHRCTADAAFAQLVTISQNLNHKLVAVAEHLIETGELPDRTTQLYRAPAR